MQTFLPYPEIAPSLECLDTRRLGKQRVEAYQLIRTLSGESTGWQHHPALRMWRGYTDALKLYFNDSLRVWVQRGYVNNMIPYSNLPIDVKFPPWFGNTEFHASHRSNLLRKNPEHYGQFGWTEPHDLPYVWPRSEE